MKKIINFLLSTLSVICIGFAFWFRFIRERLPREIPLELSLLGFMFILFICILYLLNITLILFSAKMPVKSIFKNFREYMYAPLNIIIKNLIDTPKTYPYFEKYFILLIEKLKVINHFKYYLMLELLPQILLIIIFCFDVFYFHYIKYFYMALVLNIFIIMVKIILNVCRYIMNRNIGDVEERAEILCYNFTDTETLRVVPILTASEFVQEQSLRVLNNEEKLDYSTSFKLEYAQQERKRLNIPDKIKFNTEQFDIDMRMILNSAISLYTIIYSHESEQNKYKYVRVIFNIIYFIGWSYILWISAPDLLLSLGIYMLQYLTNIEEPFSGLVI